MFYSRENSSLNKGFVKSAIRESFLRLNPKEQFNNLTMATLYIGAIVVTLLYLASFLGIKDAPQSFIFYIMVLLWLMVLLQNFAQALAKEKIRAKILKISGEGSPVYKISSIKDKENPTKINSNELKKGDFIIIKAGEKIPADGEIVEKFAKAEENSNLEQGKLNTTPAGKNLKENKSEYNEGNKIEKVDRKLVKIGSTLEFKWSIIKVLNSPAIKAKEVLEFSNKNKLQLFFDFFMSIFILMAVSLYFYTKFSYSQSGGEESIPIAYLIALLACLSTTVSTNGIIKYWGKDNLCNKEQKQTFVEQGRILIFNIASNIAKYFCIIPYLLVDLYPSFKIFNVMQFASAERLIFSGMIYNILTVFIFPLINIEKFKNKEPSPGKLFLENLSIYGAGGFLISIIGIKLIDIIILGIRIF